jgi:hypothetical protein
VDRLEGTDTEAHDAGCIVRVRQAALFINPGLADAATALLHERQRTDRPGGTDLAARVAVVEAPAPAKDRDW